jgi:hypothetical protein
MDGWVCAQCDYVVLCSYGVQPQMLFHAGLVYHQCRGCLLGPGVQGRCCCVVMLAPSDRRIEGPLCTSTGHPPQLHEVALPLCHRPHTPASVC